MTPASAHAASKTGCAGDPGVHIAGRCPASVAPLPDDGAPGHAPARPSQDGRPPVRRSLGQAMWLLGPGGCARVILSGPARMVRAGHATLHAVAQLPGLIGQARTLSGAAEPLLDRAETMTSGAHTMTSGANTGDAHTAVDSDYPETAEVYEAGHTHAVESLP